MFRQIRNRLTILYSSMLILIFILFIVIIYFVMSTVIYDGQRKELEHFAKSEIDHYEKEPEEEWEREESKKELKKEKEEEHEAGSEDEKEHRYFYYLINNEGKIVNDKAVSLDIRNSLFKILNGWYPKKSDYRLESLKLENHERHLLIVGTPLYHDGQALGYVYSGLDVTSEKHLMQKIVWILGGLALIFSLILAIAGYFMAGRAIIPVQQAYEKQKQFVADASHELRTPLAVIYSSLEILEKDEKEKLSFFARQIVDDLKVEVQLMTKLVSELLLLARTDMHKLQLQYSIFDMAALAPQVVRAFQPILSKDQIIELKRTEQLMIEGDRERIIQLLHILMDNAVKYTPKGKIILSIEREKKADQGVIRVQDEGIGISEQEQKRIFDRFYRVDKARSREIGGTGLGLSIAKSIIDAHHGRILVKTALGQGTTMTVILPIRKK